jgi:C1q domain
MNKVAQVLCGAMASCAFLAPLPATATCGGPFPKFNVASFALKGEETSTGADSVIQFDQIVTNEGGGWKSTKNAFVTPCSGLYRISIAFIKDSFGGETLDDVTLYVTRNAVDANIPKALGGQELKRVQASSEGLVRLDRGDLLQVWVRSYPLGNGESRHLLNVAFSALRVGN